MSDSGKNIKNIKEKKKIKVLYKNIFFRGLNFIKILIYYLKFLFGFKAFKYLNLNIIMAIDIMRIANDS